MLLTPECTLFLVSPSHVRKVSLIRTERVAEAGDIMEIMKDADAVLVAGGDGTIMEAVTALVPTKYSNFTEGFTSALLDGNQTGCAAQCDKCLII